MSFNASHTTSWQLASENVTVSLRVCFPFGKWGYFYLPCRAVQRNEVMCMSICVHIYRINILSLTAGYRSMCIKVSGKEHKHECILGKFRRVVKYKFKKLFPQSPWVLLEKLYRKKHQKAKLKDQFPQGTLRPQMYKQNYFCSQVTV